MPTARIGITTEVEVKGCFRRWCIQRDVGGGCKAVNVGFHNEKRYLGIQAHFSEHGSGSSPTGGLGCCLAVSVPVRVSDGLEVIHAFELAGLSIRVGFTRQG